MISLSSRMKFGRLAAIDFICFNSEFIFLLSRKTFLMLRFGGTSSEIESKQINEIEE